MGRERLDVELVKRGLCSTRELAKRLIMEGAVLVNGQKVQKPSHEVKDGDRIELVDKPKYVSRGGLKLEGAIEDFSVSVEGKVCLDVGASTGGFTDCLLQKGAKMVYAVDVGFGQLDYSLRTNPNVVVYEKVNARYLDKFVSEGKIKFEEDIDLVVMDVSFISVTKVIPSVSNVVREGSEFLVLVKPQFELEPKYIGRGGIVKEGYENLAVERIVDFLSVSRFKVIGISKSKVKGMDGNQEYFVYFKK
ncbi:MAG: TlyA family RNA methyltransferase [Brevinematia bacterium]|jgi:23S rRNA (cytidine1920-2'-O)/16S rRNA (cytidine1409-2'-O)-methyltransferase